MFSDRPGTCGRRQQMPRTMRSIAVPVLRRVVERVDERGVDEAVHLQRDAARRALLGLRARCARQMRAAQVRGRDQQLPVVALAAVAGEVVEQVGEVGAELGIGGEQADVLVEVARSSGCSCRCRRGSSGGCRRPPGARRAAPWRGSSARRGRTRRARPPLRATRARSMLACSSKRALSSTSATTCLPCSAAFTSERTSALSGAGGAVDRLLDREHVRVGGGLLDERLDRRRERVVRVVHEHVAAAQQRGRSRARRRCPASTTGVCGTHGLVLELGAVERVERPQARRGRGGRRSR